MSAIINGRTVSFVADVPELMDQWNGERNPGVDPAKVPVRSLKKGNYIVNLHDRNRWWQKRSTVAQDMVLCKSKI